MQSELAYHWQPCGSGARLLRVYGDSPCPVLPDSIEGLPVTEIGPYCFSAKAPELPGEAQFYAPDGGTPLTWPHAAAGDFLLEATLPATVTTLHNAAFYNCRKLRRLVAGAQLASLGSNVFTNCRCLQMFTLCCAPDEETGLQKLLAGVSEDVSAEFCPHGPSDRNTPAARLLYPDYLEFMDESAPAHLFILNIEGEGYRLRQCFDGGKLNFAQYDAAFTHTAESERPATLCRMALCRLLAPFALSEESRAVYLDYLRTHTEAALAPIVAARDAAALQLLADAALGQPQARRSAATLCSRAGWSEGAALALGGAGHTKKAKKTYDFE